MMQKFIHLMIMKFGQLLLAGFAIGTLLLCGCSAIQPTETETAAGKLAEEQKIGEKLFNCFAKNDCEGFCKLLPPGAVKQARQDFETAQKTMKAQAGDIVGIRFLTQLEMEPVHCFVWAVRFRRYKLDGTEVFQEMMFRAVIGRDNDKLLVFAFNFL